jgi:hypothetical protein
MNPARGYGTKICEAPNGNRNQNAILSWVGRSRGLVMAVIVALIVGVMVSVLTEPAAAKPPSCEASGTMVQFLGETCVDTTCTWEYKVCQTGFSLSHWVLGRCPCFKRHIIEVGYFDTQGDKTILSPCTQGQTTPCWEFGLDPVTGLFGLKWDNLPGPENECWTFYIKINTDLDEVTVDWASKFAACAPVSGNVTGPECPCGCGEIIAFKYYDVNRDGVYDEGDYELQGWQIRLDVDPPLTTDELGFVDFGCLSPGIYTVCEIPKDGWVRTEPEGTSPCYTVPLGEGEQVRLHFGNYEEDPEPAYIRAGKYYDYNHNGICDDPNCPQNEWEICLDGDCKTTHNICMLCGGCTGYWEVAAPGTYTLCETPKVGWVNSDPGTSPPCKEVAVEAGGEFICVPFGNWEPPVSVEPPAPREPSGEVGVKVYPVDKANLVAPWLGLALIIVVGGSILMVRRRTR